MFIIQNIDSGCEPHITFTMKYCHCVRVKNLILWSEFTPYRSFKIIEIVDNKREYDKYTYTIQV